MFAAMASVALASCVKNEPVVTPEQGEAIAFDAPVVAPATKAGDPIEYTGNFVAYAWYHNASTVAKYMPGVTVNKADDYKVADYYWPKNGELTFFAYSPAAPAVSTALSVSEMTTTEQMALTYTVQDELAKQDDLLYSSWNGPITKQEVAIAFHHALSAIQFTIAPKDAAAASKFKVKSITLNNAKTTNVLTCSPNSTAWATENLSGDGTYAILADNTSVLAENTPIQAMYKVLPQTLDGTVTLDIQYDLLNPGDASWLPQTESLVLNTVSEEWEMGVKYTYTLTFSVDAIEFAPVIAEDWTPHRHNPLAFLSTLNFLKNNAAQHHDRA